MNSTMLSPMQTLHIQQRRLLLMVAAIAMQLLCFQLPTQAQKHSAEPLIKAYPFFGWTVSQVEGDMLKGFKHHGITAGVGACVRLSEQNRWQLTVETGYSQRGVREATRTPDMPYLIKHMTLDYVDIPVAVHFTDPWGGINVGLGLCYSRLVRQPHGEIWYNPSYVVPDTSDMSFLRNDLSVVGDVRFPVWKNLKLNLRLQYSLFPIKKDWTFVEHTVLGDVESKNNCYNYSVSVRLLWLFGEQSATQSKSKAKNKRR